MVGQVRRGCKCCEGAWSVRCAGGASVVRVHGRSGAQGVGAHKGSCACSSGGTVYAELCMLTVQGTLRASGMKNAVPACMRCLGLVCLGGGGGMGEGRVPRFQLNRGGLCSERLCTSMSAVKSFPE